MSYEHAEFVKERLEMKLSRRLAVRSIAVLGLSFSILVVGGGVSAHGSPGGKHGSHGLKHVFIIMMENTGLNALVGNPNAPWINSALLHYPVAANYYGVTHPSQPNYIAATSGSLNGVNSDNDTTVNAPNIVDQLESHGKTWKAYMQSYSYCAGNALAHGCGDAHYGPNLYERKHNPFISYTDVQSNAARVAKIVDFSRFATELKNNTVPNYSWISPDQCHDMHGVAAPSKSDPCDFSQIQSTIHMGDLFLKATVHEIMSSRAWREGSAIFIQWDESDYTGSGFQGFGDDSGCCDSPAGQGGGRVLSLVITSSRLGRSHWGGPSRAGELSRASLTPYNHYSMLATIEDAWKLGCLANTCDTANVKPMNDLLYSH
jgi:hypothetical protein